MDGIPAIGTRSGSDPVVAIPISASGRSERLTTRLSRHFETARALVQSERGTDLSDIRLLLVDDEAIFTEVREETRRLVAGQLGKGRFQERLLEALMNGQRGTYAALYSGERRAVLVSRQVLASYLASLPGGIGREDSALLVLMLHELTHAADDTRHAIHASRALDFRASFAQSAVFEGHAQWRTRELCRRHGCLDGLDSLDTFMFGDTSGESDVGRSLLEYSYVEGERFVAALAARPDGEAVIDRLLSSPPHDPLQVLDPESFPDEAREERNQHLLAVSRRVEHPWLGEDGSGRLVMPTSPLKGVDLRDDPNRRQAAVDGFTRLVTAMVAVQFHDPTATTISPIEVTLMQTDSAATAGLFADTLHAYAAKGGTASARADDGIDPSGHDAHALHRTLTVLPDGDAWRTAIGTLGPFVVQASGRGVGAATMEDYVRGALDALGAAYEAEIGPAAESAIEGDPESGSRPAGGLVSSS